MTTRKKILISVITLSVALVTAIGVTIGVLAATTQNVANQFSVSYTANNVAATVAVGYKFDNANAVYFGANGQGSYSFNTTDSQATQNIAITDTISLSANNPSVLLIFKFHNDASAGGRYCDVHFNGDNTIKNNLTTTYFFGPTDGVTCEFVRQYGYTYNEIQSWGFADTYVDPGEDFYWFMLLDITDPTVDASFTSSGNDILFNLSAVTTTPSEWVQVASQVRSLYVQHGLIPGEQE